ncbi:hypothetical protein O5D80_005762 [Batrachochytrium dendrobatidis]|nr:hypothetical protein O5D80_005762 [Batrachochytrium dendrobatidis]
MILSWSVLSMLFLHMQVQIQALPIPRQKPIPDNDDQLIFKRSLDPSALLNGIGSTSTTGGFGGMGGLGGFASLFQSKGTDPTDEQRQKLKEKMAGWGEQRPTDNTPMNIFGFKVGPSIAGPPLIVVPVKSPVNPESKPEQEQKPESKPEQEQKPESKPEQEQKPEQESKPEQKPEQESKPEQKPKPKPEQDPVQQEESTPKPVQDPVQQQEESTPKPVQDPGPDPDPDSAEFPM